MWVDLLINQQLKFQVFRAASLSFENAEIKTRETFVSYSTNKSWCLVLLSCEQLLNGVSLNLYFIHY